LKDLSFTPEVTDELWSILAGILNLGNVKFEATKINNQDGAKVTDDSTADLEAAIS